MKAVTVKIVDEPLLESTANGGEPLLSLCLKEAESFSSYMKQFARESGNREAYLYKDGLASWEVQVIAGYLYQKLLGRF